MRTYYHTNFIVDYLHDRLTCDQLATIPYSTRYNWRKKKERYLGYASFTGNSQNGSTFALMLAFLKTFLGKETIKYLLVKNKKHFIHLINRCKKFSTLNSILKTIGVSKHFYFYHLDHICCSNSPIRLCFLRHPLQLSLTEINHLKMAVKEYFYWPLSSVYHFLRRKGKAAYAISTFYKYIRILGLGVLNGEYCRLDKVGIRASAPGEIIHADITEYKINGTIKAYVFAVIDNFSRKILSYAIMERKDSKICLAKISEALKYCQPDCQLLTDDGSEYAPLEYPHHLVAQADIHFSNSMIEAFFKTLKHGYLYRFHIGSFEKLTEVVHSAVNDYDNRPHHALAGATPDEAFLNTYLPPDPEKLALVRHARIAENKQKCCFK